MIILGVKDALAQKFVQLIPSNNIDVTKRDLSNVVNKPSNSIFFTNPDDFRVYELGSFNEDTGALKPLAEPKPVFYLSDLKGNVQVQ